MLELDYLLVLRHVLLLEALGVEKNIVEEEEVCLLVLHLLAI